jgi:hypothetical protein
MAFSFFASALLILTHAWIFPIMEGFTGSMMTYIFMGASLAVLRKDFGLEEAENP